MIPFVCPLRVSIGSYFTKDKVIYYSVEITPTQSLIRVPWITNKRFSNFDNLYKQLSKAHKDLPPCPKKSFFKLKNHKELDRRRNELEEFSNKLMANRELFNDTLLIKFFSIEEHTPEFTNKESRIILAAKEFQYPVSMIVYNKEDRIVIVAERLPENSDGACLLQWFEISPKVDQNKVYTKIWDSKIQEEAKCMMYNSTMKVFACGTNTGFIYILKTNDIDSFNTAVPSHLDSVSSMCFEDIENYIISVGADRNIVGTSIDGKILYSSKLGDKPLTCVRFHSESSYATVSNINGEIFICSLHSVKVEILISVFLTEKIPIHSFMEVSLNLIVCLLQNEVQWYSKNDLELSKSLGSWKSEEEITSWALFKMENVLVLGSKNGNLIFVDLKLGRQLTKLNCHKDPVIEIYVDQSTGEIISISKESPLIATKCPLH